ncbi:grasp-with-spasm system SPASM domain peptide maturase [Flavobacterium sp. '19STA2R22 D10 B1']|uniref:grasp-with-spasm system SPASM domain peptide maturase n=1 Tax=Flavobacterium aerium TaxID=3037261 RepID=UPI00278BEB86|nr:grasp-with-spasm system SPASM domain peptide maturase [Flavobacterium sp. '19STA2R22 D10 B1']
MKEKKVKLFECCIPTKGVKRGVILDLQREEIYIFPNSIIDILQEYSEKCMITFFEDFNDEKETFKKYAHYLLKHELIFTCSDEHVFQKIEMDFNVPFYVDIITLEISNLQLFKKRFIHEQLENSGCKSLILILENDIVEYVVEVLVLLNKSKIQNIFLFILYNENLSSTINDLLRPYGRLCEIVFYNAPFTKGRDDVCSPRIIQIENCFTEILNKKIESKNDFIINTLAYVESLTCNLFLNRRVYIDNEGNVKYNNLGNSFGNIKFKNLELIISQSDFLEIWSVTKDQIEICRDCEFRYICPDRRIPEKKNDTLYFHKTKCAYNPYTNEWN